MAEASESDADALRRLEARLDRAAAAAERLLGDAVDAASSSGDSGDSGGSGGSGAGADGPRHVPPAGWQHSAPDGESGHGWAAGELDLLLGVLASVRNRLPPELQQRLAEAVRELLMAVRALIDWCLERSEGHRAEPRPVQDIPIL